MELPREQVLDSPQRGEESVMMWRRRMRGLGRASAVWMFLGQCTCFFSFLLPLLFFPNFDPLLPPYLSNLTVILFPRCILMRNTWLYQNPNINLSCVLSLPCAVHHADTSITSFKLLKLIRRRAYVSIKREKRGERMRFEAC